MPHHSLPPLLPAFGGAHCFLLVNYKFSMKGVLPIYPKLPMIGTESWWEG